VGRGPAGVAPARGAHQRDGGQQRSLGDPLARRHAPDRRQAHRRDGIPLLAGNGRTDPRVLVERVHMRLENGTTERGKDRSFETCMPSLREFTQDVGPPSKEAVEDEDPRRASCIFDVTHGTLSAGALRHDGPVFAILRTETDERARLSIRPFGLALRKEILLNDGAKITARRQPRLLPALRAGRDNPDVSRRPLTTSARYASSNGKPPATWPPGFTSVDAGCSNSAYPEGPALPFTRGLRRATPEVAGSIPVGPAKTN